MTATDRPAAIAALEIRSLSAGDCRRRLREAGVGRLAMASAGAPVLRPVNFVLRDDAVVIRTGDGAILEAARRGELASFEIDEIDRLEHTGWSVVVVGKLGELPASGANLALPLRPWASGRKECFVGLSLDELSGVLIPPGRGNR